MAKIKHLFYCFVIISTSFGFINHATAQDSTGIEIENPENIIPQQYEIREVSVTGLVTGRESYLISSSGLRTGATITIPGDDISNAIKQIYRTNLFSDVQILYERFPGNLVDIEIAVEEQPRLQRYEIEGVKRSQRRDLNERLNLISGLAVTEAVKSQALNTIQRYFSEEGYWNTSIDVIEEPSETNPDRVNLTFSVFRGDRIKVREINFEGNNEFSDRQLRKSFDSIKQDRWWRIFTRHVYTEEAYNEGIENLKLFYRENGFRDIRVLEDSIYVDAWRHGRDGVYFNINVDPGPQYKVRNITWEGNTVYTDEQLTQTLGFENGDIFNETKFQQNLEINQSESDVTSLYQNIGYLFFQVMENIEIVGEDSLDLHFEIIEDEIATVREVSFTGNTKTHDDVVRRALRTVPGNTYSRSAIIRTIRELGQLGYFTPEGITPDLQPNRQERTVDIEYGLDETQGSDNFEFSGGFGGRQIGIILAARVNFNNFSVQRMFEPGGWNPIPSGDGQKLSLGIQVTGSGFQSYNFSFTEPWLRGRPTSLGVSLSYDLLNYSNRGGSFFNSQRSGINERNELFSASVSLGRRLDWPDDFFQQQTVLTFNHYNVDGINQFFDDGKADLLTLRQVIERNSTDSPISPSTGSKFSVSAEVALPVPGFSQFYKLKTGYQHHATIVDKLVLSSTVDYGYMGYFSDNNRSNFQRFFLGGTELQQRQNFTNDNINMRGFPGGRGGVISPVNDQRNLIGGRVFSKYSLELRYPAVQSEQLQLIPYAFVDAGNTYSELENFDPFELKRAAGFGARIFLPILGLVDISYGYRLDGTTPSLQNSTGLRPGEWEFLFNIGAPF